MSSTKLQHELKKRLPFDSAEQEAVLNILRTSDLIDNRLGRFFAASGLPRRNTTYFGFSAEKASRFLRWKLPIG